MDSKRLVTIFRAVLKVGHSFQSRTKEGSLAAGYRTPLGRAIFTKLKRNQRLLASFGGCVHVPLSVTNLDLGLRNCYVCDVGNGQCEDKNILSNDQVIIAPSGGQSLGLMMN